MHFAKQQSNAWNIFHSTAIKSTSRSLRFLTSAFIVLCKNKEWERWSSQSALGIIKINYFRL